MYRCAKGKSNNQHGFEVCNSSWKCVHFFWGAGLLLRVTASHKLQPCSFNSYISMHFFSCLPQTWCENHIGGKQSSPVSVLSWGPFCTGNIWSCFWTAHPLNMTPSHSLKHFSTTSEGYERTVILKLCPKKKTVAIWKKVKKGKFVVLPEVPGEGSNTVPSELNFNLIP